MNRFYNERPYGVGEYVDHLLGEQQVLLKRELREHTENNDIHVTAEDKERWNSTSEAIFGSSDPSDGDTSSTIIPTKVSQLVNDEGYLKEIPSYYATEAEVRSWLDNYVTITDYEAGEGNHYSGNEGEYVDGDIIDKFKINSDAVSINSGTKSLKLELDKVTNELKLKAIQAFTAKLKLSPTYLEYKQSGNVTATAEFTSGTMNSLSVWHDNETTPVDVMSDPLYQHTYSISPMPSTSIKFSLAYESINGDTNTVPANLSVAKRWYWWYSTTDGESTIPQNAQNELRTSKPAELQCAASSNQYIYMAFPKSWAVDADKFKYDNTLNFEYGDANNVNTTKDASGFYGDTNDYIIVQSKQKGLDKTISF